LISLSKIKANASTEHRIKGQIGHPAACMIEITSVLSALWRQKQGSDAADYGLAGRLSGLATPRLCDRMFQPAETRWLGDFEAGRAAGRISTAAVDNFVGIWPGNAQKP
jgi:hypothetical protein